VIQSDREQTPTNAGSTWDQVLAAIGYLLLTAVGLFVGAFLALIVGVFAGWFQIC
jgi:ABC-type nitrate/sulfonate/bicarbonate transport system permease component